MAIHVWLPCCSCCCISGKQCLPADANTVMSLEARSVDLFFAEHPQCHFCAFFTKIWKIAVVLSQYRHNIVLDIFKNQVSVNWQMYILSWIQCCILSTKPPPPPKNSQKTLLQWMWVESSAQHHLVAMIMHFPPLDSNPYGMLQTFFCYCCSQTPSFWSSFSQNLWCNLQSSVLFLQKCLHKWAKLQVQLQFFFKVLPAKKYIY